MITQLARMDRAKESGPHCPSPHCKRHPRAFRSFGALGILITLSKMPACKHLWRVGGSDVLSDNDWRGGADTMAGGERSLHGHRSRRGRRAADISKDGVAIFTYVRGENSSIAKEKALAGCKALPNASSTSKALCKIVATFEDQCVAEALDPQDGTPGFGWAMARNSKQAKEQALSNRRDTAGPTRKDACVVSERSLWCDGSAK